MATINWKTSFMKNTINFWNVYKIWKAFAKPSNDIKVIYKFSIGESRFKVTIVSLNV